MVVRTSVAVRGFAAKTSLSSGAKSHRLDLVRARARARARVSVRGRVRGRVRAGLGFGLGFGIVLGLGLECIALAYGATTQPIEVKATHGGEPRR